jgi:lysine/ornithine N-monooxygenase
MPPQSKALNCSLFPLYTAGAHMLSESGQQAIMRKLEIVYENIKFDAVSSIRAALNELWQSPNQTGSWFDMFSALDRHTLVL